MTAHTYTPRQVGPSAGSDRLSLMVINLRNPQLSAQRRGAAAGSVRLAGPSVPPELRAIIGDIYTAGGLA